MKDIFSNRFKHIRKTWVLALMVLPAVAYFFVRDYIPMVGILLAFKKFQYGKGLFDIIFGSPWVGFKNFEFFFISGKAFNVTKNTILYNVSFLTINTVFEILLAIVLSELNGKYFKKITQTALFLPYFVSWVIAGAFIYNIFNYEYGVLNSFLTSIGVERFNAYLDTGMWKFVLAFGNLWKWVGYGSIIYLAAIAGIDPVYYDSAKVDGANIFKRIRHITFPLLTPTLVIMTLLNLGQLLRGDLQMYYNIIGKMGNLYDATDIIDTYVFRAVTGLGGSGGQELGMASAVGLYQSVFCFVTIMIANYSVKKYDKDYSLF